MPTRPKAQALGDLIEVLRRNGHLLGMLALWEVRLPQAAVDPEEQPAVEAAVFLRPVRAEHQGALVASEGRFKNVRFTDDARVAKNQIVARGPSRWSRS